MMLTVQCKSLHSHACPSDSISEVLPWRIGILLDQTVWHFTFMYKFYCEIQILMSVHSEVVLSMLLLYLLQKGCISHQVCD